MLRISPRTAAALALALLGLWHMGLRGHSIHLPRISDEGEYAYEARLLADGGLPYRDAYNQKPPLIFLLYRIADVIFGATPEGPRRLGMVFCWASMGFLFLMVPKEWGLIPRLAAPAAFGVLSTAPIGDMGFAANTEVFVAGFTVLSAWALTRYWDEEKLRWVFLSGLAAGAAISVKQTVVWSVLAFGLLAIGPFGSASSARGTRWRSGAWFATGCALVPFSLLAYFAARGGLAELWEQAVRRNMDYASLVLRSGMAGEQEVWLVKTLAPLFLAVGWPACALAAFGLSTTTLRRQDPLGPLIAAWLGASVIGALTGLFFFPHYFLPVLPPLALAAAIGVRRAAERWPKAAGWWLVIALSLYPALAYGRVYFLDSLEEAARKLLYPNPLFESQALAEYVREHSSPDDSIYVFGSEPQIYVESGRRCATRHIFVYPLTLFPDRSERIYQELSDLTAAKPRFVVFVNQPASTLITSKLGLAFRGGVIAWLSREYRWSGTVEIRPDGSRVAIWGDEGGQDAMPDWSAQDRIYLFERRPS